MGVAQFIMLYRSAEWKQLLASSETGSNNGSIWNIVLQDRVKTVCD